MDPITLFAGFEKLFYKHIFFFCIAVTVSHGQIPMEFYVDGNNLRETGFRHYTTWGNGNRDRHVVCSTYTSAELQITIYQQNAEVNGEYYADADTNLQKYTTETAPEGIYTCRIEVVSMSNNGHNLTYSVESRLQLTRSSGSSFCETNKGRSGFIGEEIVMICNGNRNRWIDIETNQTQGRELDVFLSSEVTNEYTCVNRDDGSQVCNLFDFAVLPFLTVQIMPTSFTSDSEVLNFTCTSSPPRLLYWRVLGSNGDILDLDQKGASLKVDTNIDIEQSVGKTSIVIAEEIPGSNEIYAVICFTYQTKTKAAGAGLDTTELTAPSSNVDVVFIVFIVILSVIIIVLIFCWLGSHFLAKQKAPEVKANVETQEATLHDNPAYGFNNEYHADNSDVNVEYTYIDH